MAGLKSAARRNSQVFHVPPGIPTTRRSRTGRSASELEAGIAAVMNEEDLTPFLRRGWNEEDLTPFLRR